MTKTYTLFGRYDGGEWEEIDTAPSLPELRFLLNEYTMAYDSDWEFKSEVTYE